MNWFRRKWKEWRRWRNRPPGPPAPTTLSRWRLAWLRWRYRPEGPPQASKGFLLFRPFRGLYRWRPAAFSAPVRYWYTRRWRWLLFGLPALLGFAAVVSVGIAVGQQSNLKLASWYSTKAAENLQANKNEKALACAEAAVRLDPNPHFQMVLAELARRTGDPARAEAIYVSLLPDEARGHPPARMALAKLLLERRPVPFDRVERQLRMLANADHSQSVEASALLGTLYLELRQPKLAIPFLRRTPYQSSGRVRLAIAAAMIGDEATAKSEATACLSVLMQKLQDDPGNMEARQEAIICLRAMKNFPVAIQMLNETIALNREPELERRLKLSLAESYFDWLLSLEANPEATPSQRFAVLERALAINPNDPRFLSKLVGFTDPKSKEGEKARALLRQELTNGRNLGIAHFVLGCFASQEGDAKAATSHLEQAARIMPAEAIVLNNYSWMLAHVEQPDLERALKMANAAVEQQPRVAQIRHTRGAILIKMARWKEAIADLEIALDGGRHPDQANIHKWLAQAYDAIGNSQMADDHRKRTGSKPK